MKQKSILIVFCLSVLLIGARASAQEADGSDGESFFSRIGNYLFGSSPSTPDVQPTADNSVVRDLASANNASTATPDQFQGKTFTVVQPQGDSTEPVQIVDQQGNPVTPPVQTASRFLEVSYLAIQLLTGPQAGAAPSMDDAAPTGTELRQQMTPPSSLQIYTAGGKNSAGGNVSGSQ